MSNLLVYSASAGSGKTHQITGHYILMLFSKNKAYKNILAVTFTNKASEEMKSRIVSDLAGIINNEDTERLEYIKKNTKLSIPLIKERAQKIFKEILHDYSFFSVSTIDSFFQKILRSFTRETGIQYNYELELDTSKVISASVDRMLELSETDIELKKNIIALVEQNIENSSKWDFRRSLKDFLKKVIESDFRSYETTYNSFFSDKTKVENFRKELYNIEKDFLNTIKSHVDELENILESYKLCIDDFSGGNARSIIKRLLGTTDKIIIENKHLNLSDHFKNIEDTTKWLKKCDLETEPHITATNELISRSVILKNHFEENYKYYLTSRIIRKHFNYAALINQSLQVVHSYLSDTGKFLISEVPVFLSEIARHNSSSFIYEKTGSFYENYLIDEFQDTSKVQWDSFYPLLLESLSSNEENVTDILVGDVKQSIYSWRGGDWQLLAEKVEEQFGEFYRQISLDENWRSGKEIVFFNNLFFNYASKTLKDEINNNTEESLHNITGDLVTNKIYNNIEQKSKKEFGSVLKINLFKKLKDEDNNFKINAIRKMIGQIEELQEKGYQPGDIMILVRKNDEGTLIAEEIINYAQSEKAKPGIIYDVISSEALSVYSNKSIQLIISCFKYFVNEENKLAFTEVAYIYYLQNRLKTNKPVDFSKEDFETDLHDKIGPVKNNFRQKLLHDITDTIIKVLGLNSLPDNVPFLNSFRDIVHEYELRFPSELLGFIEYWEDLGIKQNLKIPEKQNAINIITVHKAKGLAADFVFIPFCNWELYRVNNTIWASCEDVFPFNILPVWPVNFDNKLADSFFEKDYYVNKFRQTVESFNMMYVAFTRARKGLYISSMENTEGTFNTVEKLLCRVMDNASFLNNMDLVKSEDKEFNSTEYSKGSIEKIEKIVTGSGYFDKYPVFIPEKQIKIKSFFDRDKVDVNSESIIHKGIVYHKIFEMIKTSEDVDNAINQLFYQGVINSDDIEMYKIEIKNIISHHELKPWFDNTYMVNNEIEIISKGGFVKRPDRIMENSSGIIIVDYKFGNQENPKYIRQAKEYSGLLNEMGYKNISSYIWFVMSGYLLKVNADSAEPEKILLNP